MTGNSDFVPPAAGGLPEGALDSAVAGACALDAWAGTDYGRNVLAHALVQLQRDGWLRDRTLRGSVPCQLVRVSIEHTGHLWHSSDGAALCPGWMAPKSPHRLRLHNGRNVHGARMILSGLVTTCRQYLSGPGDHRLADDTPITCKSCLRELES